MAFTQNLRRLRLERFLSQGELARRADMHPITLTRLEAGSSAPSTRSVRALADVLGVEPGDLAAPDEVAELRRVLKPTPMDGAEMSGDPPIDTSEGASVPPVPVDEDGAVQPPDTTSSGDGKQP